MTEMEWLKQESGMTDEEMKAMEAVAGAGKFKAFLIKAVAANTQATTDKTAAEQARIDLENRYQNEFVPEMRRVTQDSLRAQGEAAAATAALKAAREYGIVPDAPPPAPNPADPPRAPGSPDPAATEAQFRQWSQAQSHAINTVSELNAEHFRLFKEPLPSSADLSDEVQRQRTLGHRDFTIKQAWETKYGVPAKRAEIQAAEIQKGKDEYAEQKLKEFKQTHPGSSHPGMVSGQSSRFSTYKPSDATSGKEPWKAPAGMRKAANQPWRDAAVAKIAAA